jgi:GH25 family lysozyme M1 (1,4-beta-N-acetylmuramidase)
MQDGNLRALRPNAIVFNNTACVQPTEENVSLHVEKFLSPKEKSNNRACIVYNAKPNVTNSMRQHLRVPVVKY